MIERAAVIGSGAWGTALAMVLDQSGVQTTLWCRRAERAEVIGDTRLNEPYLSGSVRVPDTIAVTHDPVEAVADAGLLVSVAPTQHTRAVWEGLADAVRDTVPHDVPIVGASKGFELKTGLRPTQVVRDVLGGRARPTLVLSGPTHAEEVAARLPASVVVGGENADQARAVQRAFNTPTFRVYTSTDRTGVEVAGALKNVVAIAAGTATGLELGDNAVAALITRGLAEMSRLGAALGARKRTFSGLAGMGDLIVTCMSEHGRNRSVGVRLGRGETWPEIEASMEKVAEGVPTVRAVIELAAAHDVEMPIAEEVHAILFEGKDPRRAVTDLMTREPKPEN